MISFEIEVAGRVIGIETIHIRPKAICRDYIVRGKSPCINICITKDDIDVERKAFIKDHKNQDPWEGFLEVSTLLRKVTESLIDYHVFLMHGAAVALGSKGFIFIAPSGTGKTTHILKWKKKFPETMIVNGDKPFIISEDNVQPIVCGSPWAGKEGIYTNTRVPLKAIVLLERGENNSIKEISFSEAFPKLYQQIYRPQEKEKLKRTIAMLNNLNQQVSFYHFQMNNFKNDAVDVAYNALCGSVW